MSDPAEGEGRRARALSPEEKARYARQLDSLGQRIGKAKGADTGKAEADARGKAMGMGFGIAAQLVAAVGLGGLAGYYLDQWLGTKPWLLVLCLVLGFAAGMLNVVRTAREMQKISEAQSKGAKSVPFDDEDDDRVGKDGQDGEKGA
jgi:ATP synthase protein I